MEILGAALGGLIALIVALAMALFLKDLDSALTGNPELARYSRGELVGISVFAIVMAALVLTLAAVIVIKAPAVRGGRYQKRLFLILPEAVLEFALGLIFSFINWIPTVILVIGSALLIVSAMYKTEIDPVEKNEADDE